jgi:hypothetical protein
MTVRGADGKDLEVIDDYRILAAMMTHIKSSDSVESARLKNEEKASGRVDLHGHLAAQDADNTGIYDLSHKFIGGWFQSHKKKLLPPGVYFEVEIDFEMTVGKAILQVADGAPTLSYKNCFISIPAVRFDSDRFNQAASALLRNGWRWAGRSYQRYTFTVGNGDNQDLVIANRVSSLTGLIFGSLANATLAADRSQSGNFGHTIKRYSLRVGTDYFPAQNIDHEAATKVSMSLQQLYGLFGSAPEVLNPAIDALYAANAASGTQGSVVYAIQTGSDGAGINTNSQHLSLALHFENTAADAAGTVAVFVIHSKLFEMMPQMNGSSILRLAAQ